MDSSSFEPPKPVSSSSASHPEKFRLSRAALFFFVPVILSTLFQVVVHLGGSKELDRGSDAALGVLPEASGFGCSGPRRRASQSSKPMGGCAALFPQRSVVTKSDDEEEDDLSGAAPSHVATRSPSSGADIVPPPLPEPRVSPSPPTAADQGRSAEESQIVYLIEGYYSELNAGTLDASKYFAPSIDRYISMMSTTPAAINQYIHGLFKKQFNDPKFLYEPGSIARELDGSYVFAEHSSYYWVAKKRHVDQRYRVRVRVQGGKLVFFQQFEKLPNLP